MMMMMMTRLLDWPAWSASSDIKVEDRDVDDANRLDERRSLGWRNLASVPAEESCVRAPRVIHSSSSCVVIAGYVQQRERDLPHQVRGRRVNRGPHPRQRREAQPTRQVRRERTSRRLAKSSIRRPLSI
jgi:hypothetical protein